MTLESYLGQHYSPDTAKAIPKEIGIYIRTVRSGKAVYKDIVHYTGLLRNRYSKASTLNRIVSSIKVYYAYLCSEGARADNPAKAIKLRDQRRKDIQLQDLFTGEELEALMERKERYGGLDYRNKVLISLSIYQALLPAEAEALTVQDLNLNSGTVYIKSTPRTAARTLQLKPGQILYFHITLQRSGRSF